MFSVYKSDIICVSSRVGTDGSSAGGQLAGGQHNAENGPALLLRTLAPVQWQVSVSALQMILTQRVPVINVNTVADSFFFQSLAVQASFRGRTLCTGRQADAQQDRPERQV